MTPDELRRLKKILPQHDTLLAKIDAAADAWEAAEKDLDVAYATISQMSVMMGGTPFGALKEKP